MRRAIRGLSQSTGWKWRTKVEWPLARRANCVFANANACVFLCPSSEFFGWFGVRLVMRLVYRFSAKKVRATQQGAIHRSRTSDNHRSPRPTRDARRATRRVFVAEVGRKSGSRRASSEEYSSSWRKRSAMIRLPLFRVRRIFGYHSRGGPHSLFRDRTASDTDALQLEDVPTTESGHGAWRSPQLLSD